MCLESQLQELQLIQHSLLLGESFSLVITPEDFRTWTSLLYSFSTTAAPPSLPSPVSHVKFQVKAMDGRRYSSQNDIRRIQMSTPHRLP
ncbi:hypothetical protein BDR07DRAFT_1335606 [Suillus spraguei]|nr:hypothetical protein BDR07DRAFT_1335606 [Suillus spraguei]